MNEHLARAIEFINAARSLLEATGIALPADRAQFQQLIANAESELEMARAKVPGSVVYGPVSAQDVVHIVRIGGVGGAGGDTSR